MNTQEPTLPLTLIGHAIVFVDTYDRAARVVNDHPHVKEFVIIGDNVSRVPAAHQTLFKARGAKTFRLRNSGTWNPLFTAMGRVEGIRSTGDNYTEVGDLMFISLLSPHDISCALKRHRAVTQITCREMFWLDSLSFGEDQDEIIDLTLRSMPSVAVPVSYKDLSDFQRFELTAFEFARFTRPVHCVQSVNSTYKGTPFYTRFKLGDSFGDAQREAIVKSLKRSQ